VKKILVLMLIVLIVFGGAVYIYSEENNEDIEYNEEDIEVISDSGCDEVLDYVKRYRNWEFGAYQDEDTVLFNVQTTNEEGDVLFLTDLEYIILRRTAFGIELGEVITDFRLEVNLIGFQEQKFQEQFHERFHDDADFFLDPLNYFIDDAEYIKTEDGGTRFYFPKVVMTSFLLESLSLYEELKLTFHVSDEEVKKVIRFDLDGFEIPYSVYKELEWEDKLK